jgi:hypothetical protein
MIAIAVVLLALPLGLLCRQRIAANLAHIAAYASGFCLVELGHVLRRPTHQRRRTDRPLAAPV